MRESRSEGVARQTPYTLAHKASGNIATEKTPAEIDERAGDHVKGDAREDHGDGGPAAPCRKKCHEDEPGPKGHSKSLRDPREIAAFPRQQLAKRHQDKQRDEQRDKCQIEEGRANRDFFSRNGFERQRIKRASENRGATSRQKQIVENERARARGWREETALFQPARAQGKKRKRSTDKDHQNKENEDPSRWVARESMDGSQYAGAHQEGSDKRQGEGEDRKEDRPDFEGFPLFHHRRAMQQRGGGKPWHQRGILDRIPEPEAAPAKRVIGPIGAHRYAECQGNPGDQRPWPHETREHRIDPPRNQ